MLRRVARRGIVVYQQLQPHPPFNLRRPASSILRQRTVKKKKEKAHAQQAQTGHVEEKARSSAHVPHDEPRIRTHRVASLPLTIHRKPPIPRPLNHVKESRIASSNAVVAADAKGHGGATPSPKHLDPTRSLEQARDTPPRMRMDPVRFHIRRDEPRAHLPESIQPKIRLPRPLESARKEIQSTARTLPPDRSHEKLQRADEMPSSEPQRRAQQSDNGLTRRSLRGAQVTNETAATKADPLQWPEAPQKATTHTNEDAPHKLELILELLNDVAVEKETEPEPITEEDMELEQAVQTLTADTPMKRPLDPLDGYTKPMFAAHLADLIGRLDPALARSTPARGTLDIDGVSKELVKLFTTTHYRCLIDDKLLSDCLVLLQRYRQNEVAIKIQASLDGKVVSKTRYDFHNRLKVAAHGSSAEDFFSALQEMLQQQILPTDFTWSLVYWLASNISPLVGKGVLSGMHQRRISVDPAILGAQVRKTLSADVILALSQGMDLDRIMRHLDSRYGADRSWLAIDTAHKLLGLLFDQDKQELAFRNLPPGVLAMSGPELAEASVKLADHRRDMGAAITYLLVLTAQWPAILQPDGRARADMTSSERVVAALGSYMYYLLFQIAAGGSHCNCMRVIWRYACMCGSVGRRLKRSMLSASLQKGLSFSGRRRWTAAIFASGLQHTTEHASSGAVPSGDVPIGIGKTLPDYPSKTPDHSQPSPETKDLPSGKFVRTALQDIETGPTLMPTRDMLEVLQEAWHLDRTCQSKATSRKVLNLKRLRQHGITVPVVPR